MTKNKTVILFEKGDITELKVEAIVNAANSHLAHGGGLAGLIVRKGGFVIQQESNTWIEQHGIVPTGSTAVTSAGSLAAQVIIHAVGPVMGSGNEEQMIYSATLSALQRAKKLGLKSIALPAISTGIFRVPLEISAKGMLDAAKEFCKEPGSVEKIIFSLYEEEAFQIFKVKLNS